MTAEMVRDTHSRPVGLLVAKIGGPERHAVPAESIWNALNSFYQYRTRPMCRRTTCIGARCIPS